MVLHDVGMLMLHGDGMLVLHHDGACWKRTVIELMLCPKRAHVQFEMCPNHVGIILKSWWNHLHAVLESCWNRGGIVITLRPYCAGIMLEFCRDPYEIIFMLYLNDDGIVPESSLCCAQTVPEPCSCHDYCHYDCYPLQSGVHPYKLIPPQFKLLTLDVFL